ncbi:hypothetical protein NUV26_15175 [Burkholderia pseudomultivorans]|uniref:hypothetical protein n=1 Tax=Burkholderia pseudomultivorans TaxID=1207504 RepID=UPI002876E39A|nr:hypothetical protein [Burkholderia pseudomultivorans]MDS0793506.1 hypothetical protein [Burkholderia pseudomultivorans]
MNHADFNRIWAAVYGNPAWSVRKGHGSFLTLEFGPPAHLIREPERTSPEASERVRELAARRRVTVTGRWHLWIYCCNWLIAQDDKELAHSESPDDVMTFATQRIDGQKLVSVERGARPHSWLFNFDLGGQLRTWPYDDDLSCEQWFLHERDSGNVLAARADGLISYGPATRTAKDEDWTPM